MKLNSINIVGYKNIAEARLEFSPRVNCLVGSNGMGKTNVLDAIYYLSCCRSHTGVADREVVQHGAPMMLLQGSYTRRDVAEDITVALQAGRKSVRRGGKEYQRLSAHIGLLPVVLVSPQDWDLIRGSGEERRRFIDLMISQGSPTYLAALIALNKGLEQRNAMLKKGFSDPLLFAAVEAQLCSAAATLHSERAAWCELFTPVFMHYYNAITGSAETVTLHYKSHLNDAGMQEILDSCRERDQVMGYTTRGPQRDDLELLLDGYPMRRSGSQGQCKTFTVAMRLAQLELLKQQSGINPILLLDDVFDKLDAERVERIMQVVSQTQNSQIFVTDTNRSHTVELVRRLGGDNATFEVAAGVVTPIAAEQGGPAAS